MEDWKIKVGLWECKNMYALTEEEEMLPFLPRVGDVFWMSDACEERLRKRLRKCLKKHGWYEKVMEDGLQKQVVEQYVVDALSFAEAEQRITEEMSAYISGEFEVTDVKKAAYKEVFFDDNPDSDRWYKAKLDFITIDEKTYKEKRSRVTYLVQATNLNRAMKNVDDVMGGTMIDYDAASISDTKLVDVFEYSAEDKAAELMARMAEDVKDASLKVEDVVDRYVKTATPELRQQLIDKLTEIRKEKFGIE